MDTAHNRTYNIHRWLRPEIRMVKGHNEYAWIMIFKGAVKDGTFFIGESNKNPRLCLGNQGALASGKKPPML